MRRLQVRGLEDKRLLEGGEGGGKPVQSMERRAEQEVRFATARESRAGRAEQCQRFDHLAGHQPRAARGE